MSSCKCLSCRHKSHHPYSCTLTQQKILTAHTCSQAQAKVCKIHPAWARPLLLAIDNIQLLNSKSTATGDRDPQAPCSCDNK